MEAPHLAEGADLVQLRLALAAGRLLDQGILISENPKPPGTRSGSFFP